MTEYPKPARHMKYRVTTVRKNQAWAVVLATGEQHVLWIGYVREYVTKLVGQAPPRCFRPTPRLLYQITCELVHGAPARPSGPRSVPQVPARASQAAQRAASGKVYPRVASW